MVSGSGGRRCWFRLNGRSSGHSDGRAAARQRGLQVCRYGVAGGRCLGGRWWTRGGRCFGAVRWRGRYVELGSLFQGGLYDGRNTRVGVPKRRAAAQHVETSVPDGTVRRGAARQDGPHAPRWFFAVFRTAGYDVHRFHFIVRIHFLQTNIWSFIGHSIFIFIFFLGEQWGGVWFLSL